MFEKQMDRLYQSERYTLAEHMKTFSVRDSRARRGLLARIADVCNWLGPRVAAQEAQDQGQGWRGMMPGVKKSVRPVAPPRGPGPAPLTTKALWHRSPNSPPSNGELPCLRP